MADRKIPTRTCVGCREAKPKKELLRIVRTPEGEIKLDPTGRANGRGAYICRDGACLRRAQKSKGLERSLKCAIEPGVYESLEKEMQGI